MTKWLASIKSLEEAKQFESMFPDILDMKDPSRGALGALTVADVADITRFIAKRCQTSATVGDLIMDPTIIKSAIVEMATSGVDYVKIGLFPDKNISHCLAALAPTIKTLKTPVIAVLFADMPIKQDLVPILKASGFYGVMIDTALKNGAHLLNSVDLIELQKFIKLSKQHQLICGLAGALRYQDIAVLAGLDPDYLGFRSALCFEGQRTSRLDLKRVETVRAAIMSL